MIDEKIECNMTVTLSLPAALVGDVVQKLDAQGSDLETFVRLQLVAFRRAKIIRLDDLMPFGKYRGEKVETIVRTDTAYMAYILGLDETGARFHSEVANLVNVLMTTP